MSAVAASLCAFAVSAPASASGSDLKLGADDLSRIQRAEETGRPRVTLVIATRLDRSEAVTGDIRDLGGRITGGEERIGYVKASVPTGRAVKASRLPGIRAVEVDHLVKIDDPVVQGQGPVEPQTPPGPATPRANPYMPVRDIGADDFTDDPAHDGRNVTIAVLDTGVDLNHPALTSTTTSMLKVTDWFNANPPGSGDGTWVATEGRLNGPFERAGHTWVAPATGGPFAFGTLVEDRLDLAGGEVGGDLNRNGVKGEMFGVLQDRVTKRVLVDTDRDGDFTDQTSLIDYKVSGDIGKLGTDDPDTRIKEEMTFAVGTARSDYEPGTDEGSWLNIGIAGGSHGSHVAGIAAANRMFSEGGAESEMGGAAPGAQVMSIQVCLVDEGCVGSAMVDGMLYAAENDADVANLSVGGLPPLNDGFNVGNNPRAVLYNRLVDEFNMPIFIATGNDGSGANTVGDPAVARDVIAVGAAVTDETWLSNYGTPNDTPLMLMPFSSRGPSENGGMKPEIVASGSAVSTIQPWLPGNSVPGTFNLPPGYAMYNGTSMSSPQAAGGAALLIGAYKARFGMRPPADELKNAIISTADFIPGVPAHGQGTGMFNVEAAWELLEETPAPVSKITATVPVNTVFSDYMEVPGFGQGIHDREGVKSGDEFVRNYTLTRTTGDAGPVEFEVSWIGNDGTFSSASSISLPLGSPVTLPVTVEPESPGVHSAVLQLDDPATGGVDLSTQNVVFATDPDAVTRVESSGEVGRGNSQSVLIDVPAGASALRVELEGGGPDPEDGQVRFLRQDPQGMNIDQIGSSACFNPATAAGCEIGSPTMRIVENPMPGVWEIAVEAFRGASVQNSPYTLSASVLRTTVSPSPDRILSPRFAPVERSYEVSNGGEEFTGRLVGGSLASTRSGTVSISEDDEHQFAFDVPEGSEKVSAAIGNPSIAGTDLDLYLFQCLDTCEQVDRSERADSEERVSLDDPPAAIYVAIVVPYELPGGPSDFSYQDSFVNPSLGTIVTDDADQVRDPGQQWTVGATVSPLSRAGKNRTLTGQLRVVDDGGSTVGRSSVVFRFDPDALRTFITGRPRAVGQDRTPTFEFSSEVAGMTHECRVDEGDWQACTSPHTTAELSDGLAGDHRFEVRGTDPDGNVGVAASADFTVVAATAITPREATVAWEGAATRITPSARLAGPTIPGGLPGMTVNFMVDGKRLCSAQTGDDGLARCSALLDSFDPSTVKTYRVSFAGERRLLASDASGVLGERGGAPPDSLAPRIIGRLRLAPAKPRRGKRPVLTLRSSEGGQLRLVLRKGKRRRVLTRAVSTGRNSVRVPRLGRGRWIFSATVTDAAENRSNAKKLKFRVR
ncbi:MAG: S8 family serine peptidase [Actinomycetota bacterium]|nr:S8 family serine peptidase [Actinomycetota bacterium]